MDSVQEKLEQFYKELCEEISDTVKSNLSIIKKACDNQKLAKSSDFSIATIGKLSANMGGVKTQSIRNKNKNADLYKKLISAYQDYCGSNVVKKAKEQSGDYRVESIEDAETRIFVRDLLIANRKLQSELNILKNTNLIELDMRKSSHKSDASPALENVLSTHEIKALTHFMSENHLKDLGWKIGEMGRLLDSNGKPVTKPFFAEAIEKLTSLPIVKS